MAVAKTKPKPEAKGSEPAEKPKPAEEFNP